MPKPTIVLAGGGTAGHVNPLLATAQMLRDEAEIVCIGTVGGLEQQLVPQAGLELVPIRRIPLPRKPSLDLVRLPVRMRAQVAELRRMFAQRDVKAVCGFGGYVSTPVYLAAAKARIPVVIHEQNARPGLANRVGARSAQRVALTFDNTPLRARRGRTQTIGLPLRAAIARLAEDRRDAECALERRRAAAQRFGLDPNRTTVVVTGGSLGALALNQALATAALPQGVQVLHLTGRGKDQQVRRDTAGRDGYVVLDYLLQMQEALAVADLVVCRAGAGTVAELAALGLPAVFVPLAIGNGEQHRNAQGMVAAGGGVIVDNKRCNTATMQEVVGRLVGDPAKLANMAAAAATCGRTDAAARLADMVRGVIA